MWYKYLADRKRDTERKHILRRKEKEQQKSSETSVQKPSEPKKEDVPEPRAKAFTLHIFPLGKIRLFKEEKASYT